MSHRKPLLGKIFSYLTVIDYDSDLHRWICKCKCGNITKVTTDKLNSEHTKSCGCLQKELLINRNKTTQSNKKKYSEAAFNLLLHGYKKDAKRRNIKFNLSRETFRILTQQNCYYCNCLPNKVIKNKHNNGDYIYNGIDRVDNTKGYELDNCVPCCTDCNIGKKTMSKIDFIFHIKRIYNHLNLGSIEI